MPGLRFEWDAAKAEQNASNHGITFEVAVLAFDDPFALEWLDDREDYGEDRFVVVGMVDGRLLYVVYTMRGDVYRIISARGAELNERRQYHEESN